MKDLLLDLLSLLFPILFYQFVALTKTIPSKGWQDQLGLGFVCGTAIISSMLLPDLITNDFNGDLRNIPLIISLLYGGYAAGLVSFLCFLTVRCLIEVDGLAMAILASLMVLTITSFFRPRFAKRLPRWRFFIAISLTLVSFMISWYFSPLDHPFLESILWRIALIHLVAMGMITFIMEVTLKTKRLQEQILSTEKMNLASRLASSVAHEIRSPLTVVKGFLQLAKGNLEGKNKDYIENSLTELTRAEYVINDFLNYAKPQLEKMETISVTETLDQISQTVSSLASLHNVNVVIDANEKLWIRADQLKIKQALVNILKNAIEASTKGGTVLLKAYRESDNIHIQICDEGEGMTTGELTRLGTPFYSTKNNGTGLGLMVAFRIIQATGGHLEYKSEKGKGTNAVVMLPTVNG
ncbi:ATP-binding protein [Cohnella nanjingensis]|uniref:histidine kinase n=1 Tax=Cohnella nanjingensis TaxID=1387779 RepID=A0A7X0RNG8_9BACL|nr:sensor histidine kinase [Cohnella nanjingensis]MBB6670767.1 hypothetical protein [Cohnella nanjingensis]